jgi:hypothetical protein
MPLRPGPKKTPSSKQCPLSKAINSARPLPPGISLVKSLVLLLFLQLREMERVGQLVRLKLVVG